MYDLEKKDSWNVDQDRSRMSLAENDDDYLRKQKWRVVAIIVFILLAVAGLVFFLRSKPADVTPVDSKIAATIFPIFDIARNVASGVTNVTLILPPGASPHTFSPSPKLVASLQKVEALYAVGHGMDEWTFDIVDEDVDKIVVDKGLAILSVRDRHRKGFDLGDKDKEADFQNGDTDPHYWLNLANGQMIARTIAGDLMQRFPESKDKIDKNLDAYLKELGIAEGKIKNELQNVRNRKMITMHDAWYYFAVHYGLDIVGTFEPSPGREPTPKYLAELSDAVDGFGAKVIYSEPQVSVEAIRSFARDRGLRIVEIDPIGGVPGRDSYKKLIQYNARIIRENQK